ncbi:MAG: hypothetical protein GF346_04705, partial [Candidatus Eisenbacteria bacterium]|nr:hypothetical protein [Candidatus Latescibacterota bacterium]MBD3301726.1 hypothetical protein [Candidatus Eisenbacteria bacterium]
MKDLPTPGMCLLVALVTLGAPGCGEDDPASDGIPPAVVEDLVGFPLDTTSVLLTWTAPGDDGDAGRAERYDVRLARDLPAVWIEMTRLEDEPAPRAAGAADSFVVGDLEPGNTVHFRIAVGDEVGNWSDPSEVAGVAPFEGVDRTAPAPIEDLAAIRVEPDAIRLAWTATGDNGSLGQARDYDLRYWSEGIPGWDLATRVEGEPDPSRAGEPDSFTVRGLDPETTYQFAIRAGDEVPNWSSLSNVVTESTARPEDVRWSDAFAPHPRGMGIEGTVRALLVRDDRLIAAGLFHRAGNVEARNVASWDGERWSPLGIGTNGSIRAAIVYRGDLIVSGGFSSAGGTEALGLARWDGAAWHAMGDSSVAGDGPLALFDGDLVAARMHGVSDARLQVWNGSAWDSIPGCPLDVIAALTEHQGRLIAGGYGSFLQDDLQYDVYA